MEVRHVYSSGIAGDFKASQLRSCEKDEGDAISAVDKLLEVLRRDPRSDFPARQELDDDVWSKGSAI